MAQVLIRVIGETSTANRAVAKTEKRVRGLGRAARVARPQVRGVRTQLAGLSQTAGLAQSSIFQLTGGFIAAGGLLLALRATSRASINFQAETTKLTTLVGINAGQVAKWSVQLRKMAPAVGVGPGELARALFVVTSAGIRTGKALEIVELAAKASAIGLGDTATVARAVTSAMQAYRKVNLTAAEATDVLVATVREGNLQAEALAGALGRVLGITAEVGVSFAELGGFIAAFTRVGVSAEEAVTALRGILNTTLKPTKQARDALAEFGITITDVRRAIKEDGLARTLIDLVSILRENEDALAAVFGNVRALSGVLATAGAQAEEFDKIVQNVATSNGIVADGFEVVGETAKQSLAEAKAAVEVLALSIGDKLLPMIARMASGWASVLVPVDAVAEQTKDLLRASKDQNALALQLNAIGVARVNNEERIAAIELSRSRGGSLRGLQERIALLKSQNIAFAFGVRLLQEMAKAQAAAFEIAPKRENIFGVALEERVRLATESLRRGVSTAATIRFENLQATVERQLSVTLGAVSIKPRAIDTSKASQALSNTIGRMLGDAMAIVDASATPAMRLTQAMDQLNLAHALGKIDTDELARAQMFLNENYKESARSFAELATSVGPAIAAVMAQVIRAIRGEGGGAFGAISGILGAASGLVSIANPLLGAGLLAGSVISGALASKKETPVKVESFGARAIQQQKDIQRGPDTVIVQIISPSTGEIVREVIYQVDRQTRTDSFERIPRFVGATAIADPGETTVLGG